MEISFRSSDLENFVDIKIGNQRELKVSPIGYKLPMLEENHIPYMLKPSSREIDGEIWLRYHTGTSYILERVLYKLRLDGAMLRLIFSQICECIASLEKYLLDAEDLVLEPQYILYRADLRNIGLIYVPGYNRDIKLQIRGLLETLMKRFDHRDRPGLVYMYGLYDMICRDAVALEQFRGCVLEEIKDEEIIITDKKTNDKEEPKITGLVPLTNGALEAMELDKYSDTIVIGRGKRESDYRLPTNQISRIHACIYKQGNEIIIKDADSTNGTFLNYERLGQGEGRILRQGDIISFANEEFFVK
ncbi:MAG: FHA domain-containing protein [Clostridium sp.]|nr:FHA domain-containing protein [Clostridium sp.]MCM1398627.1 FHA domain-containing protein [Clostridium sp.]MCM1459913.1 FHA domain-containing protein [Bacteroides sp.]